MFVLVNKKPLCLILPGSFSSGSKFRDCPRQYWQEVILHQSPADEDREIVFGYGLAAHDAIERVWREWADQYAPVDAAGRRTVDASPFFGLATGLIRHAPLATPAATPLSEPVDAQMEGADAKPERPAKPYVPSPNQLKRWEQERELLAQWIERESPMLAWSMSNSQLLIETKAVFDIRELDTFVKVPDDAYVPPLKAKLDLAWIKGEDAWLVDWKTSQAMPVPFDFQTGRAATQLALYAWTLMWLHPELKRVHITYYSTRQGVHSDWLTLDMETARSHGLDWLLATRSEIAELNPFDPATWPATPHKDCNSCPVYSECFDRKAAYAQRKADEEAAAKAAEGTSPAVGDGAPKGSRRKGRR